jgi:branched-chain amino acid transport system substrate-binding protein
MRKTLIALVLAALTFSCGGERNPSGQGIELGFYGALTGPQATFALSGRNGARLAIDEINRTGGVLGKKLSLLSEDDRNEPAEAASAVSKLITQNHVVALIGENASSRTLAAAPIAQSYKVPMVSPSSTNVEVTKKGDYIFRVCFIDPSQGKALALFARQNLKAATAAILIDSKSDYSVGLAAAFESSFTAAGGKVISQIKYAEGDSDFSAQLTTLTALKPDVLFVPGYYTDAGLIARQARSLGLQSVLLGADGWDSPKLAEIGGAAVEGSYFSNHFAGRPEVRGHLQAGVRRGAGFDRRALLRRRASRGGRDPARRLDGRQASTRRARLDEGFPRSDGKHHDGRGPESRQTARDPESGERPPDVRSRDEIVES